MTWRYGRTLATLASAVCLTISVTLAEEASSTKVGGYLFAHMTKEDYGRLYYSVSKDGLHWTLLNEGKRVHSDYRGHPDIMRGHDGHYYLLGNPPDRGDVRIMDACWPLHRTSMMPLSPPMERRNSRCQDILTQ